MNAAETIKAAIEKLETQRQTATEGPWYPWHPSNGRGDSSVDAATHDPDNPKIVVEGVWGDDMELIVTLHRTIDAQLIILRDAMKVLTHPGYMAAYAEYIEKVFRHQLLLARVILGES